MTNYSSLTPLRTDIDDTSEPEYNMNLGSQVLMIVYIGAAVVLSVVPFGIYFYITCKKLGFGKFLKRLWNRLRKKPLTDDDTAIVNPWPYRSRPVEDYDETGAIYMIDLPTYDEVMRYSDNFKITSDIKVFYSVYNGQSSRETQTNQTTQTNALVQTDNVSDNVSVHVDNISDNVSVHVDNVSKNVSVHVDDEPPDETNVVRNNLETSVQTVSDADQSINL